jgi:hypothetical protein
MQNPFKAGEAVMTKVTGKQVLASVTKTWQNEVQVKTAEGDLLWRTVYTVWRSGEEPLKRTLPSKNTSHPAPLPDEGTVPSATPAKKRSNKRSQHKASPSKSGRKQRK